MIELLIVNYTLMINHQLLIYTSMKHSLLSLKLLALALNSLATLSDVRIKAFIVKNILAAQFFLFSVPMLLTRHKVKY